MIRVDGQQAVECVSSDECRGRANLHIAFERLVRDRAIELRGDGIPLDEVYEILVGSDEELQNSELPVQRAFPVVPNRPADPVPKVRSRRRRVRDLYIRYYSRGRSNKLVTERRYHYGLILAFVGLLSEGLLETHGYVAGTGEHRDIDRSYWSIRKYSYNANNNELYAREKNRTSTSFEALRARLPVPVHPEGLDGLSLGEAVHRFIGLDIGAGYTPMFAAPDDDACDPAENETTKEFRIRRRKHAFSAAIVSNDIVVLGNAEHGGKAEIPKAVLSDPGIEFDARENVIKLSDSDRYRWRDVRFETRCKISESSFHVAGEAEPATPSYITRGKGSQDKVRRAIEALGPDRIAALRPGERFNEILGYIESQHWGTVSEKTVRRAIKTLGLF